MRARRLIVVLPLLFLGVPGPAFAADVGIVSTAMAALAYPVPPCAGTPSPGYPELGEPPLIRVWRDGEARGWKAADCTGFGPLDANSVIATAGRFRLAGGMDVIAERVGRISALTNIKYFSVREEGWQPLFNAAFALTDGPINKPAQARRPDFTPNDLVPGRPLRFWQEENSLLSPVAYRLTVRERSAERLVYTIINEGAMKALFLRAIEPGEMRQLYIIERESEDVWRYYSLVDARTKTGPFTLSARSYINRAAAYYRYIAGIPTDQEPPAAP
jgi:hypothetical protein